VSDDDKTQKSDETMKAKVESLSTSNIVSKYITQDFVMKENGMSDQYIVNFYGRNFKFIDVPGDGNCFYHSVLKVKELSNKFENAYRLREYLINSVLSTYENDLFLQRMFRYERIEINEWYIKHSRPREWATNFEIIIFSYFLRYGVYTVSNSLNGLYQTGDSAHELNQLVKIPFNFSENGFIYLYHHVCGDPLRRATTTILNHYAYLEQLDNHTIDIIPNTIRAVLDEEY